MKVIFQTKFSNGFIQISSTWIFSILFIFILINLIFLNIKVLNQQGISAGKITQTISQQPRDTAQVTSSKDDLSPELIAPTVSTVSADCSTACLTQLDKRIDTKINLLRQEINKQIVAAIPSSSVVQLPSTKSTSTTSTQSIKELIVNFGGDGSTTSTSWTDMSTTDINFNPANYPGAIGFYFQANLRADAPDKTTYARVYDATHFVGVIGSDISSLGMTSNLVESGKLTFLSGPLRLRVQIHSLNGNSAFLDSARIRITF